MNIEMLEDEPELAMEQVKAKLDALGVDGKATLHQMSMIIIDTLLSGTGTAVLMADVLGDGVAQIVAAGNPALVPPLMYTCSEAADAMFKKPEASTVQ